MHLNVRSLAAALTLLPAAAAARTVSIPTRVLAEPDYCVWVSQLSAGPIEWGGAPDTEIAGAFFRAVVTTAEVYNDPFIEYMTLGRLGLGEWRNHDTLVLTYRDRRFLAHLGPDRSLATEAP